MSLISLRYVPMNFIDPAEGRAEGLGPEVRAARHSFGFLNMAVNVFEREPEVEPAVNRSHHDRRC